MFRYPIIDFGGLGGPGAPETPTKGGAAFWSGFWGPRGRPDPQNLCCLGPGKPSFHDHVDTKWGLNQGQSPVEDALPICSTASIEAASLEAVPIRRALPRPSADGSRPASGARRAGFLRILRR
jgi:hypothetical protein